MNFAQAAIAAQKGGQNIAGATLGNMMGGNLAQMPGFGGSANGSQAATTPGALGEAKPAASALSGNEIQSEGGLEGRIAALERGNESNVPPAPSNTLGQARPVFDPLAQQSSALLYGSVAQRQDSVNATPMFKKKCNKKY